MVKIVDIEGTLKGSSKEVEGKNGKEGILERKSSGEKINGKERETKENEQNEYTLNFKVESNVFFQNSGGEIHFAPPLTWKPCLLYQLNVWCSFSNFPTSLASPKTNPTHEIVLKSPSCRSLSHVPNKSSQRFSSKHKFVVEDMLIGHADHISESRSWKDQILVDSGSELGDADEEDFLEQILYSASFEELASNNLKYDTVIWLAISLLLVLAWGIGLFMLLYLPIRRYVLRKDLSSRRLYVTHTEVVYKVSRPSFIPFWGTVTIERRIPLSLVIDIIIEQGCLQSIYGIHTFRVESIAHGKAAPVDELQVQGVYDPSLLRKMIVTEASKITQDANGMLAAPSTDVENVAHMPAAAEGSVVLRSPSKSLKMAGSPHTSLERRVAGGLLLTKLEEVNKSVKRLELLIEKSHASSSID
ncbi:unnamed protein product [Sphenostylis stenocarpa]|uniref:DUF7642 domain-containing protein n=1 Tax=Sphenostylis stenocarpa TaxID=92480 RepID=A0AA86RZZ7_9FABA|nr:unnamed protein product [Sphenostylis stenocarpa]